MKLVLLSFCLLPLVAIPAPAQIGSWKRHSVKGEEFSVLLQTVPAMKDGKFVSVRMQLEYHFNLD